MRLAGASILCLTAFALPAQAGLFGPSNYDECITESMKGVSSNVAAHALIQACRKRFPEPKPKPPPPPPPKIEALPSDAIGRITGHVSFDHQQVSGALYNGNRGWRVTEIMIRIRHVAPGTKETIERDYRTTIDLKPLASEPFSFTALVDSEAEWKWSLIGARGIRE